MNKLPFLVPVVFTVLSFTQQVAVAATNQPVAATATHSQKVDPKAPADAESFVSEASQNGMHYAEAAALEQEKPKKAKDQKGKSSSEKQQEKDVKEVATAKRQEKPEKVETEVNASAKAPKSAARPGRGASRTVKSTSNAATKSVGKAVKAVKPVKVGGGVGVGVKVGKN